MPSMKAIVDLITKLLGIRFRGSLTLHFNGDGSIPKVEVNAAGRPEDVTKLFLT
jgi:hypothetical protein